MATTRLLQTNWSAGELSPRIEGRPDLAKFFNGASIVENFAIFPQGGATRRPGLKHICEVKDSTLPVILLPFEFSISDAFILIFNAGVIQFIKNGVVLESTPGVRYEIAHPYDDNSMQFMQIRQSADVLYIVNQFYYPRKLIRIADMNWVMTLVNFDPPPTFEADEDANLATFDPGGGDIEPPADDGGDDVDGGGGDPLDDGDDDGGGGDDGDDGDGDDDGGDE